MHTQLELSESLYGRVSLGAGGMTAAFPATHPAEIPPIYA